ncbi:hypothetical protein PUR_22520 [Paenibacillus sp. URB8-2]|nr:hypothetical protein PUR_22520 [Paenibacillus sp. URB8-2]
MLLPGTEQKQISRLADPYIILDRNEKGFLKFAPAEELKSLRKEYFHLERTVFEGETVLEVQSIQGVCLEICAEFDLLDCQADAIGIKLRCSDDGEQETVLTYSLQSGELSFDRSRSDGWSEGVRTCQLDLRGRDTLKLHIFVDTCVVEVFADDGRLTMTNNIFPDPDHVTLKLYSSGGKAEVVSLDIWNL